MCICCPHLNVFARKEVLVSYPSLLSPDNRRVAKGWYSLKFFKNEAEVTEGSGQVVVFPFYLGERLREGGKQMQVKSLFTQMLNLSKVLISAWNQD